MLRGTIRCAVVVVLVCASTASASMLLSADGHKKDKQGEDQWYSIGPNMQLRLYDEIKVSPKHTSSEYVHWQPDPTGLMTLYLMGNVKHGEADFWVEYFDGPETICTPIQSIGRGEFCVEISLPCIPAETILRLGNWDSHKSLVIDTAALLIVTAPMPEPATLALLGLALGGLLLQRRHR